MSFCPRCGAPTTPSMGFCTSCGETLAPAAPGAAAASAPAPAHVPQAQAPAARGPPGRTQEPWLVLVLTLVTLGIYQFVYWWRVSKEIDEYQLAAGRAHKPVRIGVIIGAIAFALMIPAYAAFFVAIASTGPEGEPDLAALGGGMLMIMVVAIGGMVGYVFLLVGQWRVWSGIETEERLRLHPKPLSPGLQLVFVLVPYLNLVTYWIALYRTQDRLNGLWAPPATQAWSAATP